MNVQQVSRRAARAVIIGAAGLAIAASSASARTNTPTPVGPTDGYQATRYPPPARTQGVTPGELAPKLDSFAMEERAAKAASRSLAMEQRAAARPAPAVQRHVSSAASDGTGWGSPALVGGGFAAIVALASFAVVLSRRNRLRAVS